MENARLIIKSNVDNNIYTFNFNYSREKIKMYQQKVFVGGRRVHPEASGVCVVCVGFERQGQRTIW